MAHLSHRQHGWVASLGAAVAALVVACGSGAVEGPDGGGGGAIAFELPVGNETAAAEAGPVEEQVYAAVADGGCDTGGDVLDEDWRQLPGPRAVLLYEAVTAACEGDLTTATARLDDALTIDDQFTSGTLECIAYQALVGYVGRPPAECTGTGPGPTWPDGLAPGERSIRGPRPLSTRRPRRREARPPRRPATGRPPRRRRPRRPRHRRRPAASVPRGTWMCPPTGDDAAPSALRPVVPATEPAAIAAGDPTSGTDAGAGAAAAAAPVSATGTDGGAPRAGGDQVWRAVAPLAGVLANVTVLTALLVYFGWRRSETQSQRLGIDQSVLALSTQDYLLRSIGPVLVLLIGVSAVGLAWVALDRRIAPWFPGGPGDARRPPTAAPTLRLLRVAWLVLPLAVWLLGFVVPSLAYVLLPVSIGLGALALVYAAHLTYPAPGPGDVTPDERRRVVVRAAFALLLACVCLFWTASNYAEVLGVSLADDLAGRVDELPAVALYSEEPLHMAGPGVEEDPLPGGEGELRYRYTGLRLYDHTGGRLLLVSDLWSPTYGVVYVVDDDEPIRIDFVHDVRER